MTVQLVTTTQRWNWWAGDTKPTNPAEGSTGYEVNTGLRWIYHDGNWVEDISLIYALTEALP